MSSRYLLRLTLITICSVAAGCRGDDANVTLLTTEPKVTATIRPIDDTAFDATLKVAGSQETISTVLIAVDGGLAGAIRTLRGTTVWRGDMLFVRAECGGGTSWGCNREHVFVRNGGGVLKIGEFLADDSRTAAQAFGGPALLLDTYDKLEEAPLGMSSAQRPRFRIALRHDGARLTGVDVDRTWLMNRQELASDLPTFAHALSVAQYCGRTAESAALLSRAKEVLDPSDFAQLQKLTTIVIPAELPQSWRGNEINGKSERNESRSARRPD